MMDSPPKLSGETLIVHHIPLVHCQVSGRRNGGSNSSGGTLKRSNPFSPPENLGLNRTTSLPEKDVFQREALLYSSLIHTSGSSMASHRGAQNGGGEEGKRTINVSDDSSVTSSISEDQLFTANTLPMAKPGNRKPLRRNPFLLNTGDEEYEEEDADDLSGYLEDSSFQLHSDTSSALEDVVAPFHLHDLDFATEPFLLHGSGKHSNHESLRGGVSDVSTHLKDLDLMGLDRQCRHGSSGSNMSMDCGEQDWGDDGDYEDHPMRCGRSSKTGSYSSISSLSQTCMHHFPETFGDPFHHGYASDSSCNSSDGVLVNFSAIFNRMNNEPEKPQPSVLINLNSSSDQYCTSPASDPTGNQEDLGGGAFYLDLQTSPTEPPLQQQQTSSQGSGFSLIQERHLSTSSACSCSMEHQGALALDANCNTYHPPQSGSSGDLASCLQSQARLVVATQNYYKLVSCDLSSQSSPSPAPSSVNSCSDEPSKGSPSPSQPSEYFLFRRQDGVDQEREDGPLSVRAKGDHDKEKGEEQNEEDKEKEDEKKKQAEGGTGTSPSVIKGQVYVNTSPLLIGRDVISGGVSSVSRLRSRSYDRNLDKPPSPRLGSLERMLSCPVRLSEGAAPAPPPPPRVTSFAEIARSKRRNGGVGASPPLKTNTEPFYYAHSAHSHPSGDFSPIQEQRLEVDTQCLDPAAFSRCYSNGSMERPQEIGSESCRRPEGIESASDAPPAVIRYSLDQRPTSLPIQPFTFHHQFPSKQAQPKPLLPLLSGYVSGMQARGSSESAAGGPLDEDSENIAENVDTYREALTGAADPGPGSVRPSPLGSYSPVRLQGPQSSGTCSTCTPSPYPPPQPPAQRPQNLSSPRSEGPILSQGKQEVRSVPLLLTPPLSSSMKRGAGPTLLPPLQDHCYHRETPPILSGLQSDTLSPLGIMESGKHGEGGEGDGTRTQNAHHLSPQALKWKEYRRRNPLGVERVCEPRRAATGQRTVRRNVFDFPSAPSIYTLGRLQRSQSAKPLQSDFFSDYFSLTEKPPEEFCLSPDASSSTPSSVHVSHVFVDLVQKRALVKAVNTAIDLIVAHFGTSRDPDVKAKLGNSWVSPNIGHLILKYLCPALHDVLQDGLKPYVLDLIIGQRRCQPWSLVEASTQLGPSTRVLHSLFSKVSQFPELNNTNMRINAFIFGLLNLKSLEFWFTHLHTHEDIIDAHYNRWGLLPLSWGPCRPLFQELLLLLQPLSLLPFDLDLLFEPHLLQKGAEHLRRKELLCSVGGQRVRHSNRSTFELMRGWSTTVSDMVGNSGGEAKAERTVLRQEGTWPRMEVKRRNGSGLDVKKDRREMGVGQEDRRSRRQEEESEQGRHRQERQAGWWYQLMQSSQVYIDQSSERNKFLKVDKRKKSMMERRHAQAPPTREGVVEGAESQPQVEGYENSSVRGKPTWMGSPPASVLSPLLPPPAGQEQEQSQNLRWSRLFGSRGEGTQSRGRSQKTRPPSGWFSLDRSVLGFVAQTIGAGSGKKLEPPTAVTHTTTTCHPSNDKQLSLCQSTV
ncbi:iporin isoform X3 [Cynoglossus semilaevis]|uniref:iporin isoform X3 n=1 Tax=Cynoglossus semilaevis TaxID=244447 RepID=UPI0007DC88CD|nr:iporin isoform X3 [Cynoglossus semilaevis]